MSLTTEKLYDQIFKRVPAKSSLSNHFNITVPNKLHQIDLLFLSTDKIGNRSYKYALCVVDVATRWKAARPLSKKTGEATFNALMDIYKKDKFLKQPEIINCDNGREFKNGQLKKYCKANNIEIKFNRPSFHLAFVESMNRSLAILLYKKQSLSELEQNENNKWVKELPSAIGTLNNRYNKMIKMRPSDAIKLQNVVQKENHFTKNDIKIKYHYGDIVRRMLNKDEILDVKTGKITVGRRRATDPTYSLEVYYVSEVIEYPDKLTMHAISDYNDVVFPHYFTFWQLQKLF